MLFVLANRMPWGGKRKGSGRDKIKEGKNWNDYKKNAKTKKLGEAAKSSMKIETLFARKVEKGYKKEENVAVDTTGDNEFKYDYEINEVKAYEKIYYPGDIKVYQQHTENMTESISFENGRYKIVSYLIL